jgi:hypothetical protein
MSIIGSAGNPAVCARMVALFTPQDRGISFASASRRISTPSRARNQHDHDESPGAPRPLRSRNRRIGDMRTPYLLTAVLAALMVVQSGLGLLFQGQYRDAAWIKATWFGNDWVTLVVAVPLMVVAIVLAARRSIQGLLLWLGMLGYAVYDYAYYVFGVALNVFFPLYVAAIVLSVVALILALSQIDIAVVAASFRPKAPVRMIGGYLAFLGIGLGSVWLMMWAAYAFAGRATPVEPEAFKLVAALDLSIMTTVLTFGGVLLWRRHGWGYVVAAIAGIQSSLYLLVLSVNSWVAIHRGLADAPGELPVWGSLGALTSTATVLLLTNVQEGARVQADSHVHASGGQASTFQSQ